ncbi:MAG: (d)CMP kinase, partial [Eubacteriales bacterium]|nr:(d)CMP kinase [Eubacteriales bacterium]
RQSIILDGRDIGTRVLPDATLKVFLTASPEVRAKRRFDEMAAKGGDADYQTVLADVIVRDRQDSTRAIDPLAAAEDAVTLDTSALSQAEVEEAILSMLRHKLADAPIKKPRERLTVFYRLAMWLSAFLFNILYPVRYHNMENADIDAPYILIGNHNHMLDPLLIGWKLNRYQIRYLGKKELINNPMMKALYRNMLMIPVDRHNMDMGAVRACLKALKEGHVLGIFPEGTRHKKTLMEEMESGVAMIALRGNVPILPAYMAQKTRLFHVSDCYYGKPFSVSEIAKKGVNRETCDEVMQKITGLYREMAEDHEKARKSK